MAGHFEREVEQLCQRIQSTPIDSWTVRNETLMQLKNVVESYGGHGPASEMFTTAVFRNMKEPIKAMISDLRSSNVRDCCEFLKVLSRVSGDAMRYLLRDIMQTVLEQAKVPNKVISGYVDDCIREIIYHVTYKPAIALFVTEVTTSKNKAVREFCADYIRLAMEQWNGLDKEMESLERAVISGLEDASPKVRETSRASYLVFITRFPHRAEAIKSVVRPTTLAQLTKAEDEFDAQLGEEPADSGEVSVDAADDTATVDVPIAAATNGARPTHRSRPSSGSNVSVKSYHSADDVQLARLAVGQRVVYEPKGFTGTIRYLGLASFSTGFWVGIELDAPDGKNDGSVQGERYFSCEPRHGLFCRPSQVRILDTQETRDLSKAHHAHKMYITRLVLSLNEALTLAEKYDNKLKGEDVLVTAAELASYMADVEALQEQNRQLGEELMTELTAIRSPKET